MFAMMIPFLQTIAFIVSGPDFTRLALLVAAARFQVQATLCSDTKQEVENKILEDNKKKKKYTITINIYMEFSNTLLSRE